MSDARKPAEWTAMDDEYTNEPTIYSWGDWVIAWMASFTDPEAAGWHLIVSSGVEYGPFRTLDKAKEHAENVRGD